MRRPSCFLGSGKEKRAPKRPFHFPTGQTGLEGVTDTNLDTLVLGAKAGSGCAERLLRSKAGGVTRGSSARAKARVADGIDAEVGGGAVVVVDHRPGCLQHRALGQAVQRADFVQVGLAVARCRRRRRCRTTGRAAWSCRRSWCRPDRTSADRCRRKECCVLNSAVVFSHMPRTDHQAPVYMAPKRRLSTFGVEKVTQLRPVVGQAGHEAHAFPLGADVIAIGVGSGRGCWAAVAVVTGTPLTPWWWCKWCS